MSKRSRSAGAYARAKGLDFERKIAIRFREHFPDARRQLENHKSDAKGIDLFNVGPFLIQCKKTHKYCSINRHSEIDFLEEFGEVPVLIAAGDRQKPMAVLTLDDFFWLLEGRFPKVKDMPP